MRRVASLVGLTTLWLGAATGGAAAQTSQELFQTRCAVCHTIGGGKLVGPDLQGVAERRSEDWIIRFVQHSQQLVQSGDPDAVALFEEFNGIPMPDQSLSEREIRGIIDYIGGGSSTAPAEPPPIEQATTEQILLGQALFQGTTRFANGGPTCNSCHDVINDAVIGGGVCFASGHRGLAHVPGGWRLRLRVHVTSGTEGACASAVGAPLRTGGGCARASGTAMMRVAHLMRSPNVP